MSNPFHPGWFFATSLFYPLSSRNKSPSLNFPHQGVFFLSLDHVPAFPVVFALFSGDLLLLKPPFAQTARNLLSPVSAQNCSSLSLPPLRFFFFLSSYTPFLEPPPPSPKMVYLLWALRLPGRSFEIPLSDLFPSHFIFPRLVLRFFFSSESWDILVFPSRTPPLVDRNLFCQLSPIGPAQFFFLTRSLHVSPFPCFFTNPSKSSFPPPPPFELFDSLRFFFFSGSRTSLFFPFHSLLPMLPLGPPPIAPFGFFK